MASTFIESVIDSIYNRLTDETYGINVKLASINTELTDLELNDIVKIYKGRMYVLGDQMPCMVIWPDDSPGDEHTNNFYAMHNITVYTILTLEDGQERFWKRLWRHQRATVECVRGITASDASGTTLDGDVNIIYYRGHTYDTVWPTIEGGYLLGGGTKFEIHHEETVS